VPPATQTADPLHSPNRAGFELEYPFKSHWFRSSDGTLHFLDEGPTHPRATLLMVHGNPTWSFAWRKLVASLSDEFRVVAIDHLGCGFSEKPQKPSLYTLQQHIQRLSQLIQHLQLNNITLFAHDWGGAIGMGAAAQNPTLFQRFVLMNTGAFRSTAIPLRIAACRIPLLGKLALQGLNAFSQAALVMAPAKPLTPAAKAGYLAPYNSWKNRIAVHQFVQDIPLSPAHQSYQTLAHVEQQLALFKNHPVQLIWGMQDWCFTPHEFLAGFQARFPNAHTLELPNASHYLFEDAPTELLQQSRRFLDSTHILR
jgi:haloalkane dehalogenase